MSSSNLFGCLPPYGRSIPVGIKAAGPAEALLIEFLVFFVFEFDRHSVPPSGSVVQGNHRLGKTMTSISALMFALLGLEECIL